MSLNIDLWFKEKLSTPSVLIPDLSSISSEKSLFLLTIILLSLIVLESLNLKNFLSISSFYSSFGVYRAEGRLVSGVS